MYIRATPWSSSRPVGSSWLCGFPRAYIFSLGSRNPFKEWDGTKSLFLSFVPSSVQLSLSFQACSKAARFPLVVKLIHERSVSSVRCCSCDSRKYIGLPVQFSRKCNVHCVISYGTPPCSTVLQSKGGASTRQKVGTLREEKENLGFFSFFFFYNSATCLNLAVWVARCASHVPGRALAVWVPPLTHCTQVIRYESHFFFFAFIYFSFFLFTFVSTSYPADKIVRRGLIGIPGTTIVTALLFRYYQEEAV